MEKLVPFVPFESPNRKEMSQESRDEENWLQAQFQNIQTIEVDGGIPVKVLDITPEHQKVSTPVVLAPGYATSGPFHIKENILEMVRLQRRTIFIDEPHGIENQISAPANEQIEEFFLKQISALIGTLNVKGIQKTDIVGNSEGGIVAVIAAYLYPERFENVVLCNTAGMVFGEDTFTRLSLRFVADGLSSMLDIAKRKKNRTMSPGAEEQIDKGGPAFIKHILDAKTLAYEEIKSMAQTNIREMIKEIKSKGIGVVIIHTVDDQVFPMEDIQLETSRLAGEEDLILDGFYSIGGKHAEFSINPENYTRLVDHALTSLERKKKIPQ